MVYESSKYKYDFGRFRTITSFDNSIFTGKIRIIEADKKQSNLLVFLNFDSNVRPRSKADKEKKEIL